MTSKPAAPFLVCPSCGKSLALEPDYVGFTIACCIDIDDDGNQTGPHAWGQTKADCLDAWNDMLADRDWHEGVA